jgi:hypothetical protein
MALDYIRGMRQFFREIEVIDFEECAVTRIGGKKKKCT